MYSLKFREKTYPITLGQFIALALAVVIYMILAAIGLYQFGGFLLLAGFVLLGSAIIVNGTEYAIIRNDRIRTMFAGVGMLGGFGYFLYGVFF